MMQNIDKYIVDFSEKIKNNGLFLSYDNNSPVNNNSPANNSQKIRKQFIKALLSSELFSFDKKTNKCLIENIFLFNEYFKNANQLAKISLDTFSIYPILDKQKLINLFECKEIDDSIKGILFVSHKKKIASFCRAVEYKNNVVFLYGGDVEYIFNNNFYDIDLNISTSRTSGALHKYKCFRYQNSIDCELVGMHSSIDDYFNFQKFVIDLCGEKEKSTILQSIAYTNNKILKLNNELNTLKSNLDLIDSRKDIYLSKINSARIAYDLMTV